MSQNVEISTILQGALSYQGARAAAVCAADGGTIAAVGGYSAEDQELVQDVAPGLFPGVYRMTLAKQNPDEAQMLSIPDDDLHLLVFSLTEHAFYLVFLTHGVNPYDPPAPLLATCGALRQALGGSAQKQKKSWKFWG